VTTREPTWSEQDRAEVLALAYYRATLCSCGCGHSSLDAENPEANFVVEQTTCNARLTLLEAQRGANEKRGPENAPARLWRVSLQKR
jgi:hypothetical protein